MKIKRQFILPLMLLPLWLGTTYVIRENGRETGRWQENDGSDKVEYMDNEASVKPAATAPPPASNTGLRGQAGQKEQYDEYLVREAGKWKLENEKRQTLGILNGMTRPQVEQIAGSKGANRSRKYSETVTSPDILSEYGIDTGMPAQVWIFEYQYQTQDYKHSEKIYFGPAWKVVKVEHFVVEK